MKVTVELTGREAIQAIENDTLLNLCKTIDNGTAVATAAPAPAPAQGIDFQKAADDLKAKHAAEAANKAEAERKAAAKAKAAAAKAKADAAAAEAAAAAAEAGEEVALTAGEADLDAEENGTSDGTADGREFTLEEVRAELARLNKAGKNAITKSILAACGAAKLTDIPASKYAFVMKEATAV